MTEIEKIKFQIQLLKNNIQTDKEICKRREMELEEIERRINCTIKDLAKLQKELGEEQQGVLIFS